MLIKVDIILQSALKCRHEEKNKMYNFAKKNKDLIKASPIAMENTLEQINAMIVIRRGILWLMFHLTEYILFSQIIFLIFFTIICNEITYLVNSIIKFKLILVET